MEADMKIMDEIEKGYLKKNVPDFNVGDTLRVHVKIIEGDKERLQPFLGQVIAKKGRGTKASVTLRKVSFGEGVERVFLIHSPRIASIEVLKRRPARRAKLYYTRHLSGKKARAI